jgi:hypothetical protein
MQDLLNTVGPFVPALCFYVLVNTFSKFKFTRVLITAGIMAFIHVIIVSMLHGVSAPTYQAFLQILAGVVVFVAILALIGPKISGETMMMVACTFALAPLIIPALVTLFVGLVGSSLHAAHKWKKFSDAATTGGSTKLNELFYQAGTDLGLTTNFTPNMSTVPDRKDFNDNLRVKTPQWFIVGIIVALLIEIVRNVIL